MKLLEENEKSLARDKKSLAALKAEIDKKFDKQSELDAAEKRLAEIQTQLEIDNKVISSENQTVDEKVEDVEEKADVDENSV